MEAEGVPDERVPFLDAPSHGVFRLFSVFYSFKQLEDLLDGDGQDAEGQVEGHLGVSPDVY